MSLFTYTLTLRHWPCICTLHQYACRSSRILSPRGTGLATVLCTSMHVTLHFYCHLEALALQIYYASACMSFFTYTLTLRHWQCPLCFTSVLMSLLTYTLTLRHWPCPLHYASVCMSLFTYTLTLRHWPCNCTLHQYDGCSSRILSPRDTRLATVLCIRMHEALHEYSHLEAHALPTILCISMHVAIQVYSHNEAQALQLYFALIRMSRFTYTLTSRH
jgi:hypothetical protein